MPVVLCNGAIYKTMGQRPDPTAAGTAFFLLICEMRYLYMYNRILCFLAKVSTLLSCADPESFVRGGSNFDGLFFCFLGG